MSEININGETHDTEQHEDVRIERRPRGRPRKNRAFSDMSNSMRTSNQGLKITGRPKSLAAHRKWQRDWVMPQFVVSRRQAQEMLLKYLRSKPGKGALSTVIDQGFVGLSKLPDNKLGEFLVSTNLLSRYPHEIVIRG